MIGDEINIANLRLYTAKRSKKIANMRNVEYIIRTLQEYNINIKDAIEKPHKIFRNILNIEKNIRNKDRMDINDFISGITQYCTDNNTIANWDEFYKEFPFNTDLIY